MQSIKKSFLVLLFSCLMTGVFADEISDIMVKTFMSTFLSMDESKIDQTIDEAKSALQKYELATLTQTINEMFDN